MLSTHRTGRSGRGMAPADGFDDVLFALRACTCIVISLEPAHEALCLTGSESIAMCGPAEYSVADPFDEGLENLQISVPYSGEYRLMPGQVTRRTFSEKLRFSLLSLLENLA